MNVLDTVIVHDNNLSRFSGKIGFIIFIYQKYEGSDELRYDVQFPFEQDENDRELSYSNCIKEQMQFGREDISLIKSY